MRITLSRIYIAKNDIAKNDTDTACNSGSEACVPQNNLEELVKYIVAWVPPTPRDSDLGNLGGVQASVFSTRAILGQSQV